MTKQPTVLFLCTHNAGRSQMALGFFNPPGRRPGVAFSGGSEPADQINPAAIEAMAEKGIDITANIRSVGPTTWSKRRRGGHDGLRRYLPFYPGAATKTGILPIRAGNPSRPFARSATTSRTGCAGCCLSSGYKPPNELPRKLAGVIRTSPDRLARLNRRCRYELLGSVATPTVCT